MERVFRFTEKHIAAFIVYNILLMLNGAFLVSLPEFWFLAALDAIALLFKYLVHRFPSLTPPPRGTNPREDEERREEKK